MLGAYTIPNDNGLYYIRGNLEGYMEEYGINLSEDVPPVHANRFNSHHKGPITKAERISDQYVVSSGEDCLFCVTENKKVDHSTIDFEQIKQSMFYEEIDTADQNVQLTFFIF